jgi:hypothetical protein
MSESIGGPDAAFTVVGTCDPEKERPLRSLPIINRLIFITVPIAIAIFVLLGRINPDSHAGFGPYHNELPHWGTRTVQQPLVAARTSFHGTMPVAAAASRCREFGLDIYPRYRVRSNRDRRRLGDPDGNRCVHFPGDTHFSLAAHLLCDYLTDPEYGWADRHCF